MADFSYSKDIKLLIDNSNTRTKFALADGNQLHPWRATLSTTALTPASIKETLPLGQFDSAVICSVVPEKRDLLCKVFTELNVPYHNISYKSQLPVAIDYPSPSQIGADRLANAAAIAPLTTSAVVIDFGTAVTFDVLSAEHHGTYLGGVIAPGLGALRNDLHQRTALLPQIELAEPCSIIGKSTEHAMQVGATIGYRGLIRGIISSLHTELPDPSVIYATGGDAQLIASKMPEIHQVLPELTLQGILKIGLLNSIPS